MTKRRTPGDGTLFKRADGMWIGRVEIQTTDGKRRQKVVSSKGRNECLRKLKEARAQVDAGVVVMTTSTTLGVWLDHWLEEIIKPHRTPMTHRSYEQCARLYIKPVIGTKRLDRLTPDHIRAMEKAAQKKSPRFAQLSHAVLSKALNQAIKDGRLARNPILAVEPPKYIPKDQSVFDRETATRLLKTANARGLREGLLWATAFCTGARRSELLGITWDRVDLEKGELDLSWQLQAMKKDWTPPEGFEARQCQGRLWWTRPKSTAGKRVIPLLPVLVAGLKELKELDADNPNPHDLLWHDNGRPVAPETYGKAWKTLLADADVPDARAHGIRHTAATLLMEAGVSEQVRLQLFGHSSVAMARHYAHLSMAGKRDAIDSGFAELLPATAETEGVA